MRLPERTGDQLRIGVAITVPEPYGTALQQARARFGDPLAREIPPHITLLGPTVIDPEDLDDVSAHLARVSTTARPFVVHLRGTGSFRPVSPVVFVQVVQGIAECERLESAVRSGPLAQELRFNYHPHVTVAHEVSEPALDRAFDELTTFEARFVVSRFEFYEHGDDSVWRPVRDYLLTGSGARARTTAPDARADVRS
ncbi:2'-5' RNA ligase family protein [Cellulomonas fimi]|uniref:2'-5' RNA ligase family protein n=1 Tax=Cellulomonas fimi TaxID=1708 RepID=A0A7Y0LXP6_CELFI|nr:2'-5' RNA ligase family protein [Cellulomonas fimi]NMR19895.1 2'-5' RNA ligase family protein [Cellulomonas fimi]